MRRGAKRRRFEFDYAARAREKPALGTGAYGKLWTIVDGGVRDALKAHPDYLTPKGQHSARTSIVKRVTGTVIGFAEQSARGRSDAAETVDRASTREPQVLAPSNVDAGAGPVSPAPTYPRIRVGSVKIKPEVSRAHHWGPVRRLRAVAHIERTALLMHGNPAAGKGSGR